MAEPVMVKKVTVLINHVEDNQYGDILVSGIDLNGVAWDGKIGKKRADGLRPQIAEGRWTEFGYANYMDKDYIAQAQFSQPPAGLKVTPDKEPEPPSVTPQAKSSPVSDTGKGYTGQETGMWIKELGESIRSGHLEKSYPHAHVAITAFYYQKMFEVIGIKP